LVNDRKEYNNSYVGISPQFQPLRIQIKQSYWVIDSVCIKQTLPYQIERKMDSLIDSAIRIHITPKGGKLYVSFRN